MRKIITFVLCGVTVLVSCLYTWGSEGLSAGCPEVLDTVSGALSPETKPVRVMAVYDADPAVQNNILSDNETSGYTFTDSEGVTVTVSKMPRKVAVLFSSYADIWVTAGGTVDVTVYESVERGFADEDAVIVDPGSGHDAINLETLIAAEPDFVIGTADYEGQKEAVEFCRSVGIPAASFRVECF
ncbi:MAG: ABC transporter substrate-binding protein, partial [Parasporobacterium sp.]|nr:ABC transporter substrate-binding protein [Parasporobacterium sp.]